MLQNHPLNASGGAGRIRNSNRTTLAPLMAPQLFLMTKQQSKNQINSRSGYEHYSDRHSGVSSDLTPFHSFSPYYAARPANLVAGHSPRG
jgi:hypothetical protein